MAQRIEVVGPGASRRDHVATHIAGGQDQLTHGLFEHGGPCGPVLEADDMALISHHPTHAEAGSAGAISQPTRRSGQAAAAGEAHVDVDQHLGHAGAGGGVDRDVGVDGDGDAGAGTGERAPAASRRPPRSPTGGPRPTPLGPSPPLRARWRT